MRTKQHTIKKSVSISGVGLHTGAHATMTFLPAEADHGIKFQRIDLEGRPIVEADVDNVVDCSRGTTIAKGAARVNTVEHTLAALVGLQLDNILIQIDGPEPPIMDGSSKDFIAILKEAGEEDQNVPRNFFEITEEIHYKDPENNVEIVGLPTNDYRLTVMVDYNSPVLGSQHATLNNIEFFEKEISNCRTFVFLHELEVLFKQGLIKGGDVDNAIVIVDRIVSDDQIAHLAKLFNKKKIKVNKEGFLNNLQLHHKNEPARHKLLDLVGDLALVGMPIKGQILAARPGHYSNVQFAKKIKSIIRKAGRKKAPKYDPNTPPVLDINQISNILPHRYPFQMIDKIIHLNEKYVIGVKNVSINEPFFQGHFPGNPVMPGVLQIEAMAQTGGILALNTVEDPENYWAYLIGIDKCRFRRMVIPGDTLLFKCEISEPIRRGIVRMKGQAFVGDKLVCEALVSASLVKKS